MRNLSVLKVLLVSCLFIFSCIEEIPLDTQTTFDEVLVIEGTLTNELKHQTIKLSKSYRLEEEESNLVYNAIVKVNDEFGNSYAFNELEPGHYSSETPFAAQPTVNYSLTVVEDNVTYSSSQESFTQPTQIDQLYLERDFNENNMEGISIYINSFDPTGNSKYYRYEYEETYKIIAPNYSPLKLNIVNDDLPVPFLMFEGDIQAAQDYLVELVIREQQVQVCYNSVKSNSIILANANNFVENQLEKFRIRFISRENYIMSHRYSIQVKQYVQSPVAFNFYETLKTFSLSENVFSENQSGFLEGNITSNESNKKVVGFFEVSPIDTQRIYFNYADEFPNEELPPYYIYCEGWRYPLLFKLDMTGNIVESDLQDLIKNNFQYLFDNPGDLEDYPPDLFPYVMVLEACGDCTALGNTQIPEFWEE